MWKLARIIRSGLRRFQGRRRREKNNRLSERISGSVQKAVLLPILMGRMEGIFLDMGCISMSNSVPALYREDREKEYLSIIGRYKKEEQELFPELFGYFVLALSENPAQDFLGEMYHKLGLEQEQKGTVFLHPIISVTLCQRYSMPVLMLRQSLRKKVIFP